MAQLVSAPAGAVRAQVCTRPAARQGSSTVSAAVQQQRAPACRSARRSVLLCRAAADASAEPVAPAQPADAAAQTQPEAQPVQAVAPGSSDDIPEAIKPKLMSASWQQVVDWKKANTTIETTIKSANRSGLNMQIGKLSGFLPYKLLDPARVVRRAEDGSLVPPPVNGHQDLVGQTVSVKITQVIVPDKRLIVSEKAVLLEQLAGVVQEGDVIEGTVGGIMDWGAFIECRTVRGEPCPRAEAVLPLREISYAWVANAQEVLTPGQAVRVMVLFHQTEPNSKVVVSLKRLEDDPLKETLDKVLPLNDGSADLSMDRVPASVPQGIEDILEALASQPGVQGVTLGRTVEEKRTVSQDLELWITKAETNEGYNLAVRAGRLVQEVKVATDMSADEMRNTVQRVLRSIN